MIVAYSPEKNKWRFIISKKSNKWNFNSKYRHIIEYLYDLRREMILFCTSGFLNCSLCTYKFTSSRLINMQNTLWTKHVCVFYHIMIIFMVITTPWFLKHNHKTFFYNTNRFSFQISLACHFLSNYRHRGIFSLHDPPHICCVTMSSKQELYKLIKLLV